MSGSVASASVDVALLFLVAAVCFGMLVILKKRASNAVQIMEELVFHFAMKEEIIRSFTKPLSGTLFLAWVTKVICHNDSELAEVRQKSQGI